MDKNKITKTGKSEIAMAVYMVLFTALKPITTAFSQYSTLILALSVAIILLFVLFNSRTLSLKTSFVTIIFFIFGLLLIDVLFRSNSSQGELLYNFFIYGFVPLFLLSKIEDIRIFTHSYALMAVVIGLVYLIDPLNSYKWSSNYMTFGFSSMLPAVLGCLIMIHMFNKRYFWVFMVLFLFASLIFANKGVFLSEIIMIATSYILFTKNFVKRLAMILALLVATFYIYPILSAVLDFAIEVADAFSIDSYALDTFSIVLKSLDSNSVYDSRLDIWKIAMELFSEKSFLGYGSGFFNSNYNGYTHNIFLDIMVAYGSVGLTAFLILIVSSINKIRKMQDRNLFVFAVLLLMSWILPLQVSLYFWSTMSFWLYWGICFFKFPSAEKSDLTDKRN